MSRLRRTFIDARRAGRTVLVCYLMAGVPSAREFMDHAMACLEGGADVLEIGIPFSDPVADGPVIQEASVRALENGTVPPSVLEMVRGLRGCTDKPLVLMGYYNPILRAGERNFVHACARSGVDGIIVPDLPLHEGVELRRCCQEAGLDMIQMCTPLTPIDRQRELMHATSGFLYLVSRTGVTGGGAADLERLRAMVERSKSIDLDVPVVAGFGISTPGHIRKVKEKGVDGVIVGSALVSLALEGSSKDEMRRAVALLSGACGPSDASLSE